MAYSGEPYASIRARNLLPKNDSGTALGDEAPDLRPEVAFIGQPRVAAVRAYKVSSAAQVREKHFSLAAWTRSFSSRAGERRAGTGDGPDFPVVRPPRDLESEAPPGDSGEEVDLLVAFEVGGGDFPDFLLIYDSFRETALGHPRFKYAAAVRIVIVVEQTLLLIGTPRLFRSTLTRLSGLH